MTDLTHRLSSARMWLIVSMLAGARAAAGCTADLLTEVSTPSQTRAGGGGQTGGRTSIHATAGDSGATRVVGEPSAPTDPSPKGDEERPRITTAETEDAGSDPPPPEANPDASLAQPDASSEPGPTPLTSPPALTPVAAPVADSCITDVGPGDHTFSCGGQIFMLMVDPQCERSACGLIVDIHGNMMSPQQMRDSTLLHELAPQRGYLVVHPGAAPESGTLGSWEDTMYPVLQDFMQRTIQAFHVDPNRVHVSGFGHGGDVVSWFMCSQSAIVASAASAALTNPSAACFTDSWQPRVPFFYMHGVTDLVTPIDSARTMISQLVDQLALDTFAVLENTPDHGRTRWTGPQGMTLEYVEHQYSRVLLGGYCVPGGRDLVTPLNLYGLGGTTCSMPANGPSWGEAVLQWFIDQPKRP